MKLSPEAKSLIRAARRHEAGPSDAARDRMRRRALAATIATATATGAAATGTAAAASAAATSGLAAAPAGVGLAGWFGALGLGSKLGLAALGLVVVGGGVATATGAFESRARDAAAPFATIAIGPPEAPATTSAPAAIATATATPTAEPVAPAATSAPTSESLAPVARASAATRAAPEEDALMEETALLGRAQQRLSGGDAAGALSALDEHAVRYPKGALSFERRGLRALALCALGRKEEGRAEAASVLAGTSPLADRVRAACQ
jgi:hypothetical protein